MSANLQNLFRLTILTFPVIVCFAQTKPAPDVLILVDGEKLIGHLSSANGSTVTFHSDLVGEITVGWGKVKELQSEGKFAAIPKTVTLHNGGDAAKVPQGTVDLAGQTLEVKSGAAATQTIPVADLSTVIPESTFEQGFHPRSFFDDWKGVAGLGLNLMESTTDSRNLNVFASFARPSPAESWLTASGKTSVDFNLVSAKVSSYGVVSSDYVIFQANAVREFYLSRKKFVFLGANWEHNSNQGLDLMQGYGGGAGLFFFRTDNTEFSARAGLGYVHQGFSDPSLNLNIIGSRFNQTYTHTFAHGILFTETGGFRPAWNHMHAYVTGYVASLSVPMYRRFNLSVSSFDNYVNNPPPYFKKNSLQLSLGVNYIVK